MSVSTDQGVRKPCYIVNINDFSKHVQSFSNQSVRTRRSDTGAYRDTSVSVEYSAVKEVPISRPVRAVRRVGRVGREEQQEEEA